MAEVVNDLVGNNHSTQGSKYGFHGTAYVSPKFDGKNFLEWLESCTLALKSHQLMKYINGKAKNLASDTSFDDWDSENAMVKSWLFNSMELCIRRSYLFLDTAEAVWNSITRTYSYSGNMAKHFEVKQKIWALTQGGRTLTEYYSELTSLWQESDHYTVFECKQAEDQEKYQKLVQEERVTKFLAGLTIEYDSIKNQLIGQNPFPTIEEAHGRVQLEESRRESMAHIDTVPDRSALFTESVQHQGKPEQITEASSNEKDVLRCDYCNKFYHSREECFILHPHLRDLGRGGRSRGSSFGRGSGRGTHYSAHHTVPEEHVESATSTTGTMSATELNSLRQLLARIETNSSGPSSANSAHVESGDKQNSWQW